MLGIISPVVAYLSNWGGPGKAFEPNPLNPSQVPTLPWPLSSSFSSVGLAEV